MCGIVGVAMANEAPVEESLVRAMMRTIEHRGPDGEGVYLAPGIGLGHRRLAIVDVSDASAQPMRGARGLLTYNGEIYDYAAVRARLERLGERFRSGGDVEVLLRTIERHGSAGLGALRGMFAFAYWAERDRSLLLARDRQGEKPLYYALFGDRGRDGIAFGSELRALLAHPRVRGERAIDPVALGQLLLHEYVPAPRSILVGVRKLGAGEQLEWSATRGAVVSQWEEGSERTWPPPRGARHGRSPDAAALERELVALGERVVQEELVADVPVGVFLSGGLDSSFVAACAARVGGRVRTFTIGFEESTFDESAHARAVARHIGSEHAEERFSARALGELVPSIVDDADEPLADSSLLPTTMLARLARRHVKAVLGGDGGDEVFAGYPTFVADAFLPRAPWPAGANAVAAIASRLPPSSDDLPLSLKLRQLARGMRGAGARRHARFLSALLPEDLSAVLIPPWDSAGSEATWEATDRAAAGATKPFEVATGFYLRCYLPEGVLAKVDRATMRASLEARSPLLDPRMVRFGLELPRSFRLRGATTKWLLRKAVARLVPGPVSRRPKKGFGAPVAAWLRGALSPFLRDTLSFESVKRAGLLRPEVVSAMVERHVRGEVDHGKVLWAFAILMRWHARWSA